MSSVKAFGLGATSPSRAKSFMSDNASAIPFVDTNILVYAHDADEGVKHLQAGEFFSQLRERRTGAISTQVLQEFYPTITRRCRPS